MNEAAMHKQNSFITLTYSEEKINKNKTLEHRDWQNFAKKLRHKKGPFRYYMCGEYGDLNRRPHYHACLFGIDFPDNKTYKQNENGNWLYTSPTLDALWPQGQTTIGALTRETADYTARYILKKLTGQMASAYDIVDDDGVITRLKPEYNRMSTHPGIGATWHENFHKDLQIDDCIYLHGGIKQTIPRYYDKLNERKGYDLSQTKAERQQRAEQHAANNTPDRLKVRETIHKAKTRRLKREL
jgi:hypothetical protein